MDVMDVQKEAQVWQRVRSGTPQGLAEQLPEMIAGEWADAAAYLLLSRKLGNRQSGVLYRMFQREQAHAACLKGIYTMLTGQRPEIPKCKSHTEPTLRSCYGREMHCLARYEQYAQHPEFGTVFARLAQEEREHCLSLLELLGKG